MPEQHRLVLFYTSPYRRARQTCLDIVDALGSLANVTIKEEARMREQDFGNFQSTPDEMERIWAQRAHYGHFFYRIPHGESAADVYDRVASFNETLFRLFARDNFPRVLVLVTHGIWARVFLMKWFRWSYEVFESLRNIPHCQFLVMKQQKNGQYALKTPLKTWDDLLENEVDHEVEEEFEQEVRFNTDNRLVHLDDMDIANILRAQKQAISETRHKDHEIREAFLRMREKLDESESSSDAS